MTRKPTKGAGSTGDSRKAASRPASRTFDLPELTYPTIAVSELDRLFSLSHTDPHSVVGTHLTDRGVIIRAYRPDARKIEVLDSHGDLSNMVKSHPAGFFELVLPDRNERLRYSLRFHYADGNIVTSADPYAFPPTLSDLDMQLFGEGRHERLFDKMGAHVIELDGVRGVSFSVWAPAADGVSVVGDFNRWDGRVHQMRRLGPSGVWEIFLPELGSGSLYKYEIHHKGWLPFLKADPYASYAETPPATSSVVYESRFKFCDEEWMTGRARINRTRLPLSIYEVHLGSWRRVVEEGNRPLTYREIAPLLAAYVLKMGFTHVEFLPLKEHPYGGSWGYQVSAYYAPSARYGTPDDFRFLVDYLHRRGVGVIMDWVPAHFPKDAFALGRFDGTALYEHLDPRKGEHPDWGTYIFNYARNEVRNFLLANALFWISEYHIDGLRVDAVASMLYLDYSRSEGQWVPNEFGGRENLEAISLLKELNECVHRLHPGVMMIAEESTAWPGVSHPISSGGLGFDFKWNMGWMHDTLKYFSNDPIHRQHHHNLLTFGLVYAWSENFILPLSHDEVVHMKGSLLNKMPGTEEQKFANLRALYGFMWAHPGKKLLFMGGELGQWREWNETESIDWSLLELPRHSGLQLLLRDLNRIYHASPGLWQDDSEPSGFEWIDAGDAQGNTVAFLRRATESGEEIICVSNFSPIPRPAYRIGLSRAGEYIQTLNTDSTLYGGGDQRASGFATEQVFYHGRSYSAEITLPPMATLWFKHVSLETATEPEPATKPVKRSRSKRQGSSKRTGKTYIPYY